MTIAVGILGGGGVVLAADTEYTWGYLKTSGEKIWTAEGKAGALAITGAGSGAYLEAVSQRMTSVFLKQKRAVTADSLQRAFSAILTDFHAKHVVPYAQYPREETDIWLIIGFQGGGDGFLWASEKDTLRACRSHVAAGIGREYAESLLGQTLKRKLPTKPTGTAFAERLAAYCVFQTKRHVSYCGKSTSVVALRNGRIEETNASKMQVLDYHFNAYSDVQALGLKHALGFPYADEKTATANLSNYFHGLRKDILATETMTYDGKERSLE
jgi:20S proteasome alpha/beta subunit